jgi:SAM-dependent methyltransferase
VPPAGHRRRLQRGHARAGAGRSPGRPLGPGRRPGAALRRAFDLAVSFGALGHFLPAERPALFAGVHRALRPGGVFAFPVGARPSVRTARYWSLLGFDLAMRARNAVRRPPFVMYYLTGRLPALRADLAAAGFTVTAIPLTVLGPGGDQASSCLLVLARKAA